MIAHDEPVSRFYYLNLGVSQCFVRAQRPPGGAHLNLSKSRAILQGSRHIRRASAQFKQPPPCSSVGDSENFFFKSSRNVRWIGTQISRIDLHTPPALSQPSKKVYLTCQIRQDRNSELLERLSSLRRYGGCRQSRSAPMSVGC